MGIIETLVVGGYLYTTAAFAWLFRRTDKLESNHLVHLEERVAKLEKIVDGNPGDPQGVSGVRG